MLEYPNEDGEAYLETDDFGAFPPLGPLYVLTYLEENTNGHQLFFKDCVGEKISHLGLKKIIQEIEPDIIGVTSFTISLIDVHQVAKTAREIVPDAHICMGGHHPIAFPFEAVQLVEFDSIVVGEGEVAFTQLVNALEQNREITEILGVYTRESIKSWQKNSYNDKRFLGNVMVPPGYIDDIDTLPAPNRSYIRHIKYHSTVGMTGDLATIISSRGCPYKCTFCDVPYKRYRPRAVGLVLDEVEECLAMGYSEFHFYDDLFNITSKKVIEFCDEVERRGLSIHWDFRGRVNNVTRESLVRAKNAGCRMISFGVETGTDEGLKALKKGATIAQVENVFKWCRELNIRTIADFMIGLPFEKSQEDMENNLAFMNKIDPDYAQISVLNLYPNTPLFHQADEQGLIDGDRWNAFALDPKPGFTVDHWEEFVSIEDQVKIQKKAYMKFYLRPKYILRSIFNTRSLYEFKAKAKGVLQILG
ncbi:MAG: B12-binding domain-containing radical SAM protein [Magnetococcales bacterium]|nr:B12-binding domain-containing radical SAM protein [Magnetococcales bacterium]